MFLQPRQAPAELTSGAAAQAKAAASRRNMQTQGCTKGRPWR